MGRIQIACDFVPVSSKTTGSSPSLTLKNPKGHLLSLHAISSSTIRVVHTLPDNYHQKYNNGIQWEDSLESKVEIKDDIPSGVISLETQYLKVKVEYNNGCPRLEWFDSTSTTSFMRDSQTRAYSFDAASGEVIHYVEKENHLPVSEDEASQNPDGSPFLHPNRNEYVYGLGESRGTMEKSGKKFTLEGRDALGYLESSDPLYKVNPFYLVYNKSIQKWFGVFYNNLSDASIDMGSENDVLWGCFRSYRAKTGPLDYYVMRGDGTLPSILTSYASLLSPENPLAPQHPISASPCLPPLSQFGYLASSLSLAADPKAQEAIIDFLQTSRKEGFPVDGLYLSSGWCEDEVTLDRNYFYWNRQRYPNPQNFGKIVEGDLGVQVIVNIKPWLLSTHPMRPDALLSDTFVKAARGEESRELEARQWTWSKGFGDHKLGNYFDYSGEGGTKWWGDRIKEELIANGLTGMWIDNNEMAGLVDDEEMCRGVLGMWNAKGVANNVEKRMGWNGGALRIGSMGKAVQTMGMARATFEALLSVRPSDRPVIVSRSGVPGIQAYAHGTWSGDNSTTWRTLKWGTKMTLSVGLSFGPGLYGHDIGGFAGAHHPSPELLVRWCQNGAWHSRFTVHSWKEISTTMWMYNDIPGITKIIQDTLSFRYRLAPTFYSLYVTHYQRLGHPLLKPIMWYHSNDPKTLRLDEEFIFGSHILIASVTTKGSITREIYLPGISNQGEINLMWCELDTGIWLEGRGEIVVLEAPLERIPILVKAGGILVLGGKCTRNIYDGQFVREVLIFPSPTPRSTSSSSTSKVERSGTKGSFTLIEDDGKTNDHTLSNIYSEVIISFSVEVILSQSDEAVAVEEEVEVVIIDYKVIHNLYEVKYREIEFVLPKGDNRKLIAGEGKELIDMGEGRWGLKFVL